MTAVERVVAVSLGVVLACGGSEKRTSLPMAEIKGKTLTPSQLANIERGGIELGCAVAVGTGPQAKSKDGGMVQLDHCKTGPEGGISIISNADANNIIIMCLSGTLEECGQFADKLEKLGAEASGTASPAPTPAAASAPTTP